MKRLHLVVAGLAGCGVVGGPSARAQSPPAQFSTPQSLASGQSPAVRAPRAGEIQLLQALRANPATAPYPFTTEPRGSKILLRGRVGARITHDVAIRLAIGIGVPVEDGIVIDTGFNPRGGGGGGGFPGGGGVGGFGAVPGPGPTLTGGVGFGGPPSFGNYGIGGGGGGIGGGGYGGAGSALMAYPSAGSYGGAPSLLPPPIFGRYDDPFYGFDPPAVVYPPWWGALNAQRVQSNAGFTGAGAPGGPAAGVQGQGPNPGQAVGPFGAISPNAVVGTGMPATPANATETDIGPIPDGTIDMEIDGAGVATIRGGVPTAAERIAIGHKIGQTPGVTQVINLLTLKPSLTKTVASADTPPPDPVDASQVGANPAPPAIVSAPRAPVAAGPVVNATRPNGPAIDPTSDAAVSERARRGLADRAATIGAPVQVKVRDGVAQLAGKVPTVYEAMLAYRSVQQTPGIRSIEDRLEFAVPDGTNRSNPLIDKGRPDDVEPYLEAQIRRQVGSFAHVDRVRIQADALDLRGTLARGEDRDRFDAILRSMPILRGFQVHSDMPVAAP